MRAYLAAVMVVAAVPAVAQNDDRGFLTGLIEDNLSGVGREVRIEGFQGALSSRATFTEMTIADGEGVWLTIRDAGVSWNRAALLRGAIQISELSAAEIVVARLPRSDPSPGLPKAEATPFRVPELPVSVQIGSILAESVTLGEPLLGEQIVARVEGALSLAGGEGAARLAIERTDATSGSLSLDGAFVNATDELTLDLSLSEPQGGIAATLLKLPGEPALDLAIKGAGPLSDFVADLTLSSDGQERLEGRLEIAERTTIENGPVQQEFALTAQGDLAPLFAPEFRDFFGQDLSLVAEGSRSPGGETRLDRFDLRARSMTLTGALTLGADGLPTFFDLDGTLADPSGARVRLPTAGEPVTLDGADVALAFDAARGEQWSGTAAIRGLETAGNRIDSARLQADGTIVRGAVGGRRVAATLDVVAEGLSLTDPGLSRAVGGKVAARATLLWREGLPLAISNLTLSTPTARLTATGTIGSPTDGAPFEFRASANAETIEPLSTLAGRPLGGRAILSASGTSWLLDGRFDLRAAGVGRDLSLGIDALDRAVAGETRLLVDARRDETGVVLRALEVSSPEMRLTATGTVRDGATDLNASARVEETGRVVPGLSGPGALRLSLRQTGPETYDVTSSAEGPGRANAGFDGTVTVPRSGGVSFAGRLGAQVQELSAFSTIAGRPLAGALRLDLSGDAAPDEDRFSVTLDLSGERLALDMPTVDRLLDGRVSLSAAADRLGDVTTVRRLTLATGEITGALSGTLGRSDGRLSGEARLRNVALFAPDFPGPATLSGSVSRAADGTWSPDLSVGGPGGTTARLTGRVAATGDRADLRMVGEAPLGLANAAIAPRALRGRAAFDLTLNGVPGLPALSGRISTSDARLVAPTLGLAVDEIGGVVTLSGGRAAVDLSGAVDGGGRVAVQGSAALTGANQGDIAVTLTGVQLSDPQLYRTEVNGRITVTGPLAGGGLIAGALDLGPTEVRVAPTGSGTGDDLPGLRHLNEPADVRLTRLRAGFQGGPTGEGRSGAGSRPFALDLLIRAPNRIFIRGRGLDAELGGALRLAGTTNAVIPQGQFDLVRGRLDILGRRLSLDEGLARLDGSFDPFVRLVATTEADDISVRVVVEGLVSAPDIRFESSPALPQDEVLARLFFGRSITELSPLQAARLASALATLAGRGGTGVVERLRQNFGLDDFDITTDADGNAAVRAGRYLSENVYTDVTVGADGKADVSINLDVSRSVTVKGRVGSDGETGIGVFFERDY